MKPVIAIVGRPNVGKSTLFNRITRSRDAIVADFPGLTRDRHYGDGRLDEREFIVVDTGGFEPTSDTGLVHEMARQTRQAVAEADAVIFVVDVRGGLSAQDHDIAGYLRQVGKPVVLAANKAEGMSDSPLLGEFFELGLGAPHPISAAHGQGVRSLLEEALAPVPAPPAEPEPADGDDATRPIRLAVAGRPNVGKSTLINAWLGEERVIAFDQPGTTRDAIRIPFERQGRRYELIDTAGLRRKGRVFEAVEKFSVVKTLQAIAEAHVVLLLVDATQGVTDQDAHIAGYVLDNGRALVIAINKWDAVDAYQREMVERSIEQRLAFVKFAPRHPISAQRRQGLGPVWASLGEAYASATRKLPTPALTRLVHEAVERQAPKRVGAFRPKLRYAHQGGMNPPVVVIHGNSLEHVTDSYKRYLEARIREAFKLVGTPLRLEMRSSRNPFVQKDS
ncbi:MAG: ribosome biogenesis GTPase Der [Ideonella sp.]|jgi:GTP-binding protein|nr:ribosome biogenesis GTPase Der [Ideonella sp.]